MSNDTCPKCSSSLEENSTICSNCGHLLDEQMITKIDSNFDSLHKNNPFRLNFFIKEKEKYLQYQDPKTYIQPSNYVNTSKPWMRIVGSIILDAHVVEEIAVRKDLHKEGAILFLLNLTIVALIQIVSLIVLPNKLEVVSVPGIILDIILRTYVSGIIFIYSIPLIGRFIGYTKSELDNKSVIRVLSYAYLANTVTEIASFYTGVTQSSLLAFIWVTVTLYYLIVFSFVIRRSMHKGYLASIVTVIIAIVINFVLQRGAAELIKFLFDGSYKFSNA